MKTQYRVDFTRRFTNGTLMGLTHDDSLTFPTKPLAIAFWANNDGRVSRTSIPGSDYEIECLDIIRVRGGVSA